MNEWKLTDEEIEQAAACGEYEYADSVPEEGQFDDEELLAGQRAIADAAVKKLVGFGEQFADSIETDGYKIHANGVRGFLAELKKEVA